jgi:microsomal dipeptidase-like Zn-dependent dipeptidase
MMKYPVMLLLMGWLGCQGTQAQPLKDIRCIDMCVGSSQKAYKSSNIVFLSGKSYKSKNDKLQSVWKRIDHRCPLELPLEWQNAFKDMPKYSQSTFLDLIKGNVEISNQVIYPTEQQFFQNTMTLDIDLIYACGTGLSYVKETFAQQNVKYFEQVAKNLIYLEDELSYGQVSNGQQYSCRILRNRKDIEEILERPNEIGCIISIQGGHALGSFVYIDQQITNTKEYQEIVLSNIDKLKGLTPLEELDGRATSLQINVPIFSLSFGNYYQDGVCGKTNQFNNEEQYVFGKQSSLGDDISELGQKIIDRLLSRELGYRILIDVTGMSLKGREWYYGYVKEKRYLKDTIPILASNVGISGLPKRENLYSDKDERGKANQWLSHRHINLCREDISEIIASKGLIGISLERDKLMGPQFRKRYEATVPNSADRRRVAVEAIVANVCKTIEASNRVEAWDAIAIASQFDTHQARPLDVFRNSGDMYQLYRDLYSFFKNPRDIEGLYTAQQIKNYMYDFTPEEIVERIMYRNALNFIMKHLPKKGK